MLHLYAALAEKERRADLGADEGRTRDPQSERRQTRQPDNIREAGDLGRTTAIAAADDHARTLLATDSDHDLPIFPNLAKNMAADVRTSSGCPTSPVSPSQ